VKIREDAPLDVAALLGCGATTGIGSVLNTAGLKAGENIAIYGCGGVGLSAVLGAKVAGAGKIIAIDLLDQKLEMAKDLGADCLINASGEDAPKRIVELTGGGADYALECIGNVDVLAQAFASLRSGGKCVLVGIVPPGAKLSIPAGELAARGKVVTGAFLGSVQPLVHIPKYVDLFMAGKLPLDKLITRSYSLDEINDAFRAMEEGEVRRSVIRF